MTNTYVELDGTTVSIDENTVCTIRKILKEDIAYWISNMEDTSHYSLNLLKNIAEVINKLVLYMQKRKCHVKYFMSNKVIAEIEEKIYQQDKLRHEELVQQFGEENCGSMHKTEYHIYLKQVDVLDEQLIVHYSCYIDSLIFGGDYYQNFEVADIDSCILPDMINCKNAIDDEINAYNKKIIKNKKKEQELLELQERFNLCLNELIESHKRISCIKEEVNKLSSMMNSDYLDDIVLVIQSANTQYFFFEKECSFNLIEKFKHIIQIQKAMRQPNL